jgi:hypothetical protein
MSTLITCTSSTRPGSPSAGDTLFETDTNKVIVYSGTAWKEYQDNGQLYNDSDITGLSPKFWLDGANGDFYEDSAKTTSVSNRTDFVGCWADRSGNSFDFTQTNNTLKPNIVTNVGRVNNTGLIYSADHLVFTGNASSDTSGDQTLFMALMWNKGIDGMYFIQTSDSSTRGRIITVSGEWSVQFLPYVGSPTFGTSYSSDNTAKIMDGICLLAVRLDSTANTTKIYLNGGSAQGSTTAGSGSFLKNGITTELFDNSTGLEDPCILLDTIFFDSALSNSNMDTVYSYLSKKYGTTVTSIS